MKILIIGTVDADYNDREEVLCERLFYELGQREHDVDVIYLPFKRDMLNAVEQIMAYSLVNSARADALITIGYPACFVSHPGNKKISYLFDCYPEIHEKFGFKLREHRVEERVKIIENITIAEENALVEAKAVFVASEKLQHYVNTRYKINGCLLLADDTNMADRIEEQLV